MRPRRSAWSSPSSRASSTAARSACRRPNVSLVDFKFVAKRATNPDEVNAAVKEASKSNRLTGILGYTEEKLVSSDFNHDPRSSVFAVDQTKVIDGNFVRVVSWYDNEWGFSNRMADTAVAMSKLG